MWTGLDIAGNPISQSFIDPEVYDDILPIYKLKPENPLDRDSKMQTGPLCTVHHIFLQAPVLALARLLD